MNLLKLALFLGVTAADVAKERMLASADEDSTSIDLTQSEDVPFQHDSIDDPTMHVLIPEGYYTLCTTTFMGKKMQCMADKANFESKRESKYVYALKNGKHKAAVFHLTYPNPNIPDFQLECATCAPNKDRSGKVMTTYHTLVYEPLNVNSQTYDSTIVEATFWAKRADHGRSKDTFKIRTSGHHFARKWLTPTKLKPRKISNIRKLMKSNVVKLTSKLQGTASWTLYPVDLETRVVASKPFTLDV